MTEAKRGPFDTIAKHKLACAVWAVRCNIPDAIPIIAVYLRVTETDQGIEFNAAECTIDDGRDGLLSLHSVEAVRHRRLRLRSPVGEPRPRTRLWLQAHTRGPNRRPYPYAPNLALSSRLGYAAPSPTQRFALQHNESKH